MHFALRENSRVIGLLLETAAVGSVWLVAVTVGPYGTFDQLTTVERMQYWGMSIVLNWIQIRLVHMALDRAFACTRFWVPVLLACCLASVPGTFEVMWLEDRFRPELKHDLTFATLYPQVLLLSLAVTVPMVHYFTGRRKVIDLKEAAVQQDSESSAATAAPGALTGPPFLQRIPIRLGRDLLCLQAEDHYVRVHTALGDDLILHRFSDCVQELDGIEGLRVHRSWWIARAAVADVARRDRKTWLLLTNGLEVPVSRTYMAAVKEAGWS
ncbi:MAG: LytTR family DNA-binding domain-containing protein [Minwuia sp.]|nr:LytTR family DNA-binding domain-containing protein [Minwuia sp.]